MRLFEYFSSKPGTTQKPLFRKALLSHLPRMLRESRRYRSRIPGLPDKYRYAILASEIASSLVYKSSRETDFMDMVEGHLKRVLGTPARRGD
jgi:glutamate dehydrogenase